MTKERKTRWGWIYVLTFVGVFIISVIIKLTFNPLEKHSRVDWNEKVGTMVLDLPYGEGEAQKFDLYLPADSTRESYGLVAYLHAGGFTAGDKAGDRKMLQWLCSKGYVAAGINYTLCSEAHPEASVYSQSVEIRESIPVVVAEAAKRGYLVDRMAVSGGSAGGTLALLYAYRDAAESPVPVRMVFEMVGPPSFIPADWGIYGLDQSPEAAAALFSTMSGRNITPEIIGTPAYDDSIRCISAYMWVDSATVPTLCAYGAKDCICPFPSVRHLVGALERNNVPHHYIECPHSGHGLQNDNRLMEQYLLLLNEYLDKYMSN